MAKTKNTMYLGTIMSDDMELMCVVSKKKQFIQDSYEIRNNENYDFMNLTEVRYSGKEEAMEKLYNRFLTYDDKIEWIWSNMLKDGIVVFYS